MCPFCPRASRRTGWGAPGPHPERPASWEPRTRAQGGLVLPRRLLRCGSAVPARAGRKCEAGQQLAVSDPSGQLQTTGLAVLALGSPCAGPPQPSLQSSPGAGSSPVPGEATPWVPRQWEVCVRDHVSSLIKMVFHLNVLKCTNYLQGRGSVGGRERGLLGLVRWMRSKL